MRLRAVFFYLPLIAIACSAAASAQVTLPKILSATWWCSGVSGSCVGNGGAGRAGERELQGPDASDYGWTAGPLEPVFNAGCGGRAVSDDDRGQPASAGGDSASEATAAAPQTITLDDVLVGDVWVASGQSNMEFLMRQAATADQDLPHADNDHIRLLMVKKSAVDYPQEDIGSEGWTASTPESAKEFSAVAWYFAREIEQREHVPVGVIDSTWGGTPVEAWVRMEALGEDASLTPLFASWGRMTQGQPDALLREKMRQQAIDAAKAAGKPTPMFPWTPVLESWGPGMLYNG